MWRPQGASTSSYYEVGVGNRDIAILGMNGTFSPARFGQDGQAGRVLTWGSGAAVWADLTPGVSPITAVTTSNTSGLDGGGTNGALALSVNPNRLTSLSETAVATDDELILYNLSVTATERVTIADIASVIGTSSGTDNGNAREFIIPISDAGGTVNDITITTGENITLQNGDEFYFVAPTATNTGDVTITVDSNTTLELVKSDGLGARIQMAPGETRRHGYDLIRFTRGFVDQFTWESAIQGNAAAYNVGILEGNLVTLNTNAVIDSNRLGTGGAAGEVLTWASGTATWETAASSATVAAGEGIDVAASGNNVHGSAGTGARPLRGRIGYSHSLWHAIPMGFRCSLRAVRRFHCWRHVHIHNTRPDPEPPA